MFGIHQNQAKDYQQHTVEYRNQAVYCEHQQAGYIRAQIQNKRQQAKSRNQIPYHSIQNKRH